MYFLFRETKFPASKLKLTDLPNMKVEASLGTGLELSIFLLCLNSTLQTHDSSFCSPLLAQEKMICSFSTLWDKIHQYLPKFKMQISIDYGTELGSIASLLLLSKGGVTDKWGWEERPKGRVAKRCPKQSGVFACLWCSSPSTHWYQQGEWGPAKWKYWSTGYDVDLKEVFCP